jgi:hypothetical protein
MLTRTIYITSLAKDLCGDDLENHYQENLNHLHLLHLLFDAVCHLLDLVPRRYHMR